MCYNYRPPVQFDKTQIGAKQMKVAMRKKPLFSSYYTNGFNHEELPIVTGEQRDTIQFFSWGLVPNFIKDMTGAKDIRNKTLNARSETIFTTNSFKHSIQSKRCLVPALGFFEWRTVGKDKYPYHIQVLQDDFPDDSRLFCFAGIYNNWVDKETGEVFDTFSIITTEANEILDFVHNSAKRMPVILAKADEEIWLDPSLTFEQLDSLMKPYPSNKMIGYSISKLITSRSQNPDDPDVLKGYDYNIEAVPSIISIDEITKLVAD